MNGDGVSEDQVQPLISTTNISGAGSASLPSQFSSPSTPPNSTQNLTNSTLNDSTAESSPPSETNGITGNPNRGEANGQQITPHDKGRESEFASEGRNPQPSMESVKAEETALEPVNVQIELLEHTPDAVVDDAQDWAPDGDHEMKRVKVSAFTSNHLYLMNWG